MTGSVEHMTGSVEHMTRVWAMCKQLHVHVHVCSIQVSLVSSKEAGLFVL